MTMNSDKFSINQIQKGLFVYGGEDCCEEYFRDVDAIKGNGNINAIKKKKFHPKIGEVKMMKVVNNNSNSNINEDSQSMIT